MGKYEVLFTIGYIIDTNSSKDDLNEIEEVAWEIFRKDLENNQLNINNFRKFKSEIKN